MDIDVKKWLTNIKSTSRKRKADYNDDNLVKELTFHCIESITSIIKKEYTNNKNININVLLEKMKYMYNHTKDLSKNKKHQRLTNSSDLDILTNAYISINISLINELLEIKKTKKFDIFKCLEDMKKQYDIPAKERKLNTMKINLTKENLEINSEINSDNDIEDDTEYETSDEEYIPSELEEYNMMHDSEITDKNVIKFITELNKTSNANSLSKDYIIDYFSKMNKNEKTDVLNILSSLSKSSTNIPYVFNILKSPLNNTSKKNIISKMLNVGMDSSKIKKWIDDVMKIPFGIYKGLELEKLNNPNKIKDFLDNLKTLMDKAVYGHNHAKKHIVMMMAHMIRNPECMGNVFGIWGPPGNGKSSLVKEGIAKAMDRPFVFISLGGASDSSFLDGHSFTYEGSIYGRIAQALINSKCMNPIIYFDELDKVSESRKGEEIINTLIHLLDPVQNKLYRDKYFYDIDLDLSKVTFIFSFNDPHKINYILRDRISMIETKFLSNEMKLFIAKNHLMVDICKDLNMNKDDIIIPEDILLSLINDYTNEGGVRRLKEHLYKIARELNHINLTNNMICGQHIKFPYVLTNQIYKELFNNISKYIHLRVHKEDGIGMVNGLWANSLGQGGVLPIESALIPAKELLTVKTTGSLGDVIKESIDVALSVAWNKLEDNMKLYWMNKWKITPECFHIHCPDGSTGKEGPSAGAAMTLTFYSRLVGRKVKHNVAMTGEINLRQEVTEIGGLDEKLNAAKRAGATLALIPYNNMTDLNNVIKNNPSLIDDNFTVICVSMFDDVIKYALN